MEYNTDLLAEFDGGDHGERRDAVDTARRRLSIGAMTSSPEQSAGQRPRIHVIGTGGTIAAAAHARSAIGYRAGEASINDLLATAPGIEALAVLSAEQVAAIGSQDMNEAVWFALRDHIVERAATGSLDGVVITHGTDTIEETALFLDLTLSVDAPVILTGAMRPAAALSADGPANLFQAVKVAASREAVGRGVLVVANDAIHSADQVEKRHTTALETFRSKAAGPVGFVNKAQVGFYGPAVESRLRAAFASIAPPLPRVDVIFAHAGMDAALIGAALDAGARGIVLSGVGGGNASQAAIEALGVAAEAGVLVVRSSRCGDGLVSRNVEVDDDRLGFVASETLGPPKARVLAQLLLASGVAEAAGAQRAFASI